MKSKPNCGPGGTLSKTILASCSGGHWQDLLANTGEPLRLDTGRILGRIHQQGILSGILGGIHWRATLGYSAEYSAGSTEAGSTGELLWDTQRDTRRDPLVSRSGGILGQDPLASRSGGIFGGIHWRAALAGYSAGSTGEQLWRDTGRDPLASSSGGILGGIHWRAALAGYSAGSTGELLWRDTGWGRGVEASQTRIPT